MSAVSDTAPRRLLRRAAWLVGRARRPDFAEHSLAVEIPTESGDGILAEPDPEALCTLTITENHEDALLFEYAHMLARHLGANTMTEVVDAIVGEAMTSLLPLPPKDAADPNDLAPSLDAQNAYIRQRNQWRDEAERLCEPRIPSWPADDVVIDDVPTDFTGDPASIDASLRQNLCTRCHLDGVHGGRFTVTREGPSLVWRFGNHTVVVDRNRYRAG